jgi:rSAM/selenodomain-associated transferase 1
MKNTANKPVRIIVFAKAPQPGLAKTRLIPALGERGAAALARQMLLHTLAAALEAEVGAVELCVTPGFDEAAWRGILLPNGISISAQGEGDLGARLARAAQRANARGERVLLIGTDCVEMSAGLLQQAAQKLVDCDAVIHCTADGGYALLGLTRFNPFLFGDMPWSTDAVASVTVARLGQLGWSTHVAKMLHDVDEPQDLKRLPPHWREHVAA